LAKAFRSTAGQVVVRPCFDGGVCSARSSPIGRAPPSSNVTTASAVPKHAGEWTIGTSHMSCFQGADGHRYGANPTLRVASRDSGSCQASGTLHVGRSAEKMPPRRAAATGGWTPATAIPCELLCRGPRVAPEGSGAAL